MAAHVRAMLEFHKLGVPTVDYGNNIRQMALEEGVADAFAFPGFVPAYVRPLFCRGIGPFRWAALSGDPEDIYRTDEKVKELLPDNAHLHNWLDMARKRIKFQGLPARICWVGLGDRAPRSASPSTRWWRSGELKAPIVIGRDHLDSGSVASPNRETEAMRDGSDAVSDWPMLNALLNCASGATWVSLHHGGGVGMGFSQHAGMVIVCDGTPEAARRIERVLWNDPATGVMRHADAGYETRDRLRPRARAQPAEPLALTQIAGVAERIAAGLRPDGEAVRLAADLDLVDLAGRGVDAIDLVVEAAAQPEIFAVGADIAHVGAAAAGDRPGLHHLARGELDHRDAALGDALRDHHLVGAAVGDIERTCRRGWDRGRARRRRSG